MDFLNCNDWIEFKAKQTYLFLVQSAVLFFIYSLFFEHYFTV